MKGGLSKVRIDKWLGIPDLPAYESFKAQWHSLVRLLKARIAAEPSEEVRRNVNLYFVRVFFMAPYEGAAFCGRFLQGSGGQKSEVCGRGAVRSAAKYRGRAAVRSAPVSGIISRALYQGSAPSWGKIAAAAAARNHFRTTYSAFITGMLIDEPSIIRALTSLNMP